MCHDQWLIKEHILQLREALSDQNLQLLPGYAQRIEVLRLLDELRPLGDDDADGTGVLDGGAHGSENLRALPMWGQT